MNVMTVDNKASISHLRILKYIAGENDIETISAHPLVSKYSSEQLSRILDFLDNVCLIMGMDISDADKISYQYSRWRDIETYKKYLQDRFIIPMHILDCGKETSEYYTYFPFSWYEQIRKLKTDMNMTVTIGSLSCTGVDERDWHADHEWFNTILIFEFIDV